MENTTAPTSVTELQTQLQLLETKLAEHEITLCRPIYTNTPPSLEDLQTELQIFNTKLAELGIEICPCVGTKPQTAASISAASSSRESGEGKDKTTDNVDKLPEQMRKADTSRSDKKAKKTKKQDLTTSVANLDAAINQMAKLDFSHPPPVTKDKKYVLPGDCIRFQELAGELANEMGKTDGSRESMEIRERTMEGVREVAREIGRLDARRIIAEAKHKARLQDARERKGLPGYAPQMSGRRMSEPMPQVGGSRRGGPHNTLTPSQSGMSEARTRSLEQKQRLEEALLLSEMAIREAILLSLPPLPRLPDFPPLPPLRRFGPALFSNFRCSDPGCLDYDRVRDTVMERDLLAGLNALNLATTGRRAHFGLPPRVLIPPRVISASFPLPGLNERSSLRDFRDPSLSEDNYLAEEAAMGRVHHHLTFPQHLQILVSEEIDRQVRREVEGGVPPFVSFPRPRVGPWARFERSMPPKPTFGPFLGGCGVAGCPCQGLSFQPSIPPPVGRQQIDRQRFEREVPRSIPRNEGGLPVIVCGHGPAFQGRRGDAGRLWGEERPARQAGDEDIGRRPSFGEFGLGHLRAEFDEVRRGLGDTGKRQFGLWVQ